ncbi:MAG: TonB-dependent receptor [Pseudomonadota bacterium]
MFRTLKSTLPNEASPVALGAILLLSLTTQGQAQQAAADQPIEQVVVTGTRLTTGMQTPTPVTAVSAEQLQSNAPNNIADALNQLPSFSNSTQTTTPSTSASTGTNGQNILNLRGLGDNRNLVLLNGHRMVATNTENSVDINILPQNLVSRVDVVTGGASAAYGSDAVAGVVNFVLNTDFRGLKGDIGGGISTYGDMGSYKGSLAWGGSFLDGKLGVIASTQYFNQKGIPGNVKTGRAWFDVAAGLIPNTTGSGPANILVPDIRSSIGTLGGLISKGPLAGTQFLAGGTPAPFDYGFNSGTGFQSGGDGARVNNGFSPDQWRTANFVHAEYSATPDDTVYAEFLYSFDYSKDANEVPAEDGSQFQFTIYSGNPYIPASIQSYMTAHNVSSFALGRYLGDYPMITFVDGASTTHEAVGIKGNSAFGMDGWKYDISYSSGQSHQYLSEDNVPLSRNLYAAADAVVNPANGQIVCRSTLSGLDAGCQPLNLFGPNSVAPSAIPFTIGNSYKNLALRQNVWQANLSGDFGDWISLGAGPISFATGAEYRQESALQSVDPISPQTNDFTGIRGGPAALNGKQGPYRFFNPLPFAGSYNVSEGFLELGVPILKDLPFARALNADAAVRYTDYSLAGPVTTWKYGLDYQVIDDVRLRGTVSQDIRAPDLLELFNSATQNSNNALYPTSQGGSTTPALLISKGNPDLQPEKAITVTYGVVLTPTFIDNLSLSADYYDIRLKGAIGTVSGQNEIDYCYNGQAAYCSFVSYANGTLKITTQNLNLNVLEAAGYDFEGTYNTRLFDEPLGFRLLATHQTKNISQAPSSPILNLLDGPTTPSWKVSLQARYVYGDFSFSGQERYISELRMDPTKQQGVFTDNNNVPSIYYTDVTVNYNVETWGMTDQLYLSVNNLFNQNPPTVTNPPTTFSNPTQGDYDRIGRYFTAGLRVQF